jgi:hypothetical protein
MGNNMGTLKFPGHQAETFSAPDFAIKNPCAKCGRIYGFVTSATAKDSYVNGTLTVLKMPGF